MAIMRWRGPLIGVLLAINGSIAAQVDATSCEHDYGTARALYDDGRLNESVKLLDSLLLTCGKDKDQLQRILFLKAVIDARNDSIADMRRGLEQLFRNDRNYTLKPYDPLIVGLNIKEQLYSNYELLAGSRELGPGRLQKDQGLLRAGVLGGVVLPRLDVTTDRVLHEEDGTYSYEVLPGWEAGALLEWDVIPNLALRFSGTYGTARYRARNKSIQYEEQLTSTALSFGIKKMFWLKDSPWVPYVIASGSFMYLLSAQADIERSGDGVKFLDIKSLDRIGEREQEQYLGSGAIGLSRKVGHVVLFVEGRYDHAFTSLTRADAPYSSGELLVQYYHVDNDITMSRIAATAGVQYVVRYHSSNRIYR